MTRPKVPDDKRQRTAQACDSCKRRKQKCNGVKPCQTCIRRKLTCSYTPNSASDYGPGESAGSPTKRRHIETSPPSISATLENANNSSPRAREVMQSWDEARAAQPSQASGGGSTLSSPTAPLPPPLTGRGHVKKVSIHGTKKLPSRSNTGNANGYAEETNIYTETRMLQDQSRRLLYIGDASTLSILQLIRIIVESTSGAEMGSPFIDDPKRHRIQETIIDFPENTRVPTLLPDQETTQVLIASYFTNTCGIVEIFDRKQFMQSVEACYRDPPSANNYFLCHLFLVLALGLLFAAPVPGSREEHVIQKQLSARPDRAELYFRSARTMCDPGAGFEDADFWSVQALSLMTLYMLTIPKRNTAYAYLGMAVRSAYALGLHREETMRDVIFTPGEMKVRRNLWKTLFILDRFLAATLGRPTAISGHDCSMNIFSDDDAVNSMEITGEFDPVHAKSLHACVETCRIIGDTLRVFSSRKISTTKVQEIVNDMSMDWEEDLQAALHRRLSNAGPARSPAHGMASLHVNLLALHSLILLTRQLFVMHNWMLVEQRSGKKKPSPIHESPMARFSEACVLASYQTIQLVQQAREEQQLPRRNPFVIYFVFAASLVILMNQFSSLYYTNAYDKTIRDAVDFMEYCTKLDPQAERVLDIITRFAKVVDKWTKSHKYDAPPLSEDLSFLYSHPSSPQQPPDPGPLGNLSGGPVVASPLQQEQQHDPNYPSHHHHQPQPPHRIISNDPGLLTPPTITSKMPLSDILAPTTQDTRMNGMSPHHHHHHHHHQQQPLQPIPQQQNESPGYNRELEFDFDHLWNNWLNLPGPVVVPPTPTVPVAGISPLTAQQFSPVAPPAAAAPEPFPGAYTTSNMSPLVPPAVHHSPPGVTVPISVVSGVPPPGQHAGLHHHGHHNHHHGNVPLYHSSSTFG
ncbi:fungal-specific transcription factor domain-containing protein [Triangularia setosa]|uniref:Fungal-specific transcription factor domain-containing protein n=1 Tax=Triangularia setosa TaxID=2587417 RepID=A0AAN7A3N6_9PEZI|nr:fungal-specific transcription factor domain-containing protein [Podospora setosa]